MEKFSKYDFSAINFKSVTALRFRNLSKVICRSNTDTMDAMLDFFEIHQLSPLDSIDGSLNALEARIKKRIGAAIAIIKDIEKHQTKPTTAMLQSLFVEKLEEEEEPEIIERKFSDTPPEEQLVEATVPKIRYERLEDKLGLVKQDFTNVLDKVKTVKNSFGKDYLKLELTKNELIKFKRTLANI